MQERYIRNANSISEAETKRLHRMRVAIVGLGGLGGYVAELLARVGVGTIAGFDDDTVGKSNLNRQLFATEDALGLSKAEAAGRRIANVNSGTAFTARALRVTGENAEALIAGVDVIVDCCDNVETRLTLERAAEALGVPLVHGAIAGWYGQVGVCFPGDRLMSACYGAASGKGAEELLGNPSFTPACIASLEAAQTVKVLLGKQGVLRGRLLYVDLLDNTFTEIRM